MKRVFILFMLMFLLTTIPIAAREYFTLTVTAPSDAGAVLVSPPGQEIRGQGFILFAPGTEVTLETVYTLGNMASTYCPPAITSHQWAGDWPGDPAAHAATIVMDRDIAINITFGILPRPCPFPVLQLSSTPVYITRRAGKTFTSSTSIVDNDGGGMGTNYSLILTYDPLLIQPDSTIGNNGVENAIQVDLSNPGELHISGQIDTPPLIHWITLGEGTGRIIVNGTVSEAGGFPRTGLSFDNTKILVSELPGVGDVNGTASVNIVDALAVARYAIGQVSPLFNGVQADVDQNGSINIIDALQIVQFYVGLIELQGK